MVFLAILGTGHYVYGQLAFEGFTYEGAGQPQLESVTSVAVSPTDEYVYSASLDNNAVNTFKRNKNTGRLEFLASQRDGENGIVGLRSPYAVALSPDGTHLYVAGFEENAIVVFQVSPVDGSLQYQRSIFNNTESVEGLSGVFSLSFSPDANFLYATSIDDNALVVFERDVITGDLYFVEKIVNGTDGITEFSYPVATTVSPDGSSLYVSSFDFNAIFVFQRDKQTGKLTYVEKIKDGQSGVSGLQGAYHINVSPDNEQVFITGQSIGTLAVFNRSQTTGELTFVESFQDNQALPGGGNVDGLAGALLSEIDPSGSYLYVLGSFEDAISIFNRQPDGRLNFVGLAANNVNNIEGLAYPYDLNVTIVRAVFEESN